MIVCYISIVIVQVFFLHKKTNTKNTQPQQQVGQLIFYNSFFKENFWCVKKYKNNHHQQKSLQKIFGVIKLLVKLKRIDERLKGKMKKIDERKRYKYKKVGSIKYKRCNSPERSQEKTNEQVYHHKIHRKKSCCFRKIAKHQVFEKS